MKIIDNSVVFNMYQMKVKDEFRSSFNEVGKRNMVTSSTIESGTLGMYNTMNDAGETSYTRTKGRMTSTFSHNNRRISNG